MITASIVNNTEVITANIVTADETVTANIGAVQEPVTAVINESVTVLIPTAFEQRITDLEAEIGNTDYNFEQHIDTNLTF
ncbi:MAG: hypothetical protein AAF039_15110 [Bacteroidota bacterium]